MIVLSDGIKELSKHKGNNDENLQGLKETVFELFNRLNRLLDQSDLDVNAFEITELQEMKVYWDTFGQDEASKASETNHIFTMFTHWYGFISHYSP